MACRIFDSPIQDSIAKRPNTSIASQKCIPYLGREVLRLRLVHETHAAVRTTKRDRHNLALCLARLDVLGHERAVGKLRAREDAVLVRVADLRRSLSIQSNIAAVLKPGGTYVRKVDHGFPAYPKEHVQECQRDRIVDIVLAVVRQALLVPTRVLAPVHGKLLKRPSARCAVEDMARVQTLSFLVLSKPATRPTKAIKQKKRQKKGDSRLYGRLHR